jgi:hypothetical protein
LASSNSHYDELLRELKEKGERLANQYVPELYIILREEEKLPPEDCRAKIEHDCIDLWSRATIRKYLPSEAKDFKKQAAGKIGSENKKKNKKALLLVAQSENDARMNLAENDIFGLNEQESMSFNRELDQQLSTRTLSPELLEANKIIADKDNMIERLRNENEELLKQHNPTSHQGQSIAVQQQQQLESELSKKDTIIKELKIQIDGLIEQQIEAIKGNNSNENRACSSRNNDQYGNSIIDFEMSLPFEEVRIHMESIFKKNKGLGKVSFHWRLNLKTGKVVAASIGSMTEGDEDFQQ